MSKADERMTPKERAETERDCYRRGRKDGLNEAASIIIEATRIPDCAIRRGTGVRDEKVIFGEQLAGIIRERALNKERVLGKAE